MKKVVLKYVEIGVFAHTQAIVAFKAGSGRNRGGPY